MSSRRRSKPCARAYCTGAANEVQFARVDGSACAALIETLSHRRRIASTMHVAISRAAVLGAPREVIERHPLTIDQATALRRFGARHSAFAIGCLSDAPGTGAFLR